MRWALLPAAVPAEFREKAADHLEDDMCIGVGDMADYIVETGKGRYIDEAEVMEILQRAEDNGLVHQITNIDGEDKIFAICTVVSVPAMRCVPLSCLTRRICPAPLI